MYENLVEPNAALVRHIALKFKPSRNDLQDYIQIGYVGLFKSARSFLGGAKFSTYAYRSIFWEIANYHKKIKKFNYSVLKDNYNLSPINLIWTSNLLDQLDKDELEILKSIYIDNKTVKELSKDLNKSKSTIYRMYNKIIKKLKDDSK